jgi:methyl-accepting chemotaxis protein
MSISNLPISRRIHLITAAATFGLLVMLGLAVNDTGVTKREGIATKTRQIVEAAHGVLVHYEAEARAGRLTQAQAQAAAIAVVKTLRYEGSEYFWINDMHPRMVMHPIRPDLDGKDLADNKDPTGKRLFVAFVDTVRKDGAGFVDYMWPKPGASDPVEKVSYVKGFAPWGWIIGSGVYVDDVDAAVRAELIKVGGIGLLVLATLIAAASLIARSIVRPTTAIVDAMQRVASGDLDSETPGLQRKDEVGALAQALEVFRAQGHEAKRLTASAAAEQAARERRQRAMEGFTADFSSSVSGVLRTLSPRRCR